jgi:hypothetical protein
MSLNPRWNFLGIVFYRGNKSEIEVDAIYFRGDLVPTIVKAECAYL